MSIPKDNVLFLMFDGEKNVIFFCFNLIALCLVIIVYCLHGQFS